MPADGGVPGASGRAEVLRKVAPGTATNHRLTAVTNGPRRTIGGCCIVIAVIAILHPLPHVAGHIVEAERIGLNDPTGEVCRLSHWVPQPLQLAFPLPMSSPQK
jgi:hypothetical protein